MRVFVATHVRKDVTCSRAEPTAAHRDWETSKSSIRQRRPFTFGATALATVPLQLVEQGETGATSTLAPYLFLAANLTVGLIGLGTMRLIGLHWMDRKRRSSQS
jgi:hypothetical protein